MTKVDDALGEAVSAARRRYAEGRPQSAALHARATEVMPGGNTRTALHFDPFPIYVAHSAGARITDVDGRDYLDVLGEYTAGLYGHSEPRILAETERVMRRGITNGAPAAHEIAFAEAIHARFPSVERVRFCNSGTEANLFALTLARIVTGRPGVMVFRGGYHGGVLGFPTDENPMNVPFDFSVERYNDLAIGERIAALGESLAAVIVEPMLSNGGCIAADPAFLEMLRQATAQTGALLVFDEVVTSRMSGGGLQQRLGIRPDLTTFGKYLGAGFSFGAFGGRADLIDRFAPGGLAHAGTFNNNVFSMAVGGMAFREIFTPARADALYADGERLREALNEAARRRGRPVRFTGCGSVMNVQFTEREIRAPQDVADIDPRLTELFHFDLLEAGIYAARRGQINLSLPMNGQDFSAIVAAVGGFLDRRGALVAAAAQSAAS